MKKVLLFILIAKINFCFSQQQEKQLNCSEIVLNCVFQKPSADDPIDSLTQVRILRYFKERINNYPERLFKNCISRDLIVQFKLINDRVDTTQLITIGGIDVSVDSQIIKLFKQMPPWNLGSKYKSEGILRELDLSMKFSVLAQSPRGDKKSPKPTITKISN